MDIILETKDLTKTYKAGGNHINAVDHTSICVERGDFVTIVGKSGSGKSTLLHLIGGLDYPTSGEVWIDNECITNMNEEDLSAFRRRKIGFIFQAFNLVPSLNVWENIILPIGLDDRKPDMVYLKEIIELLGLSEKLNNLPNTLSGGQQQRVAIARALATKPAIVLADEPTGNLDSKTSDEVMALLKTSAMKYEQTLIVITHNEDIAQMGNAKLHTIDPNTPEQSNRPDSRTREVQAESVAYAVCQHYGLDTSEYSFGYVAGWSSGRELAELKASLEIIRSAAHELISALDEHLAELRQQRETELSTAQEAAFALDNGNTLFIQTCDSGYDYTLYGPDNKALDGGQLDAPGLTLPDAGEEALALLGQTAAVSEVLLGDKLAAFREAAEKVNEIPAPVKIPDLAAEPTVTILWSENDKLQDGEIMPLSVANRVFEELDTAQHTEREKDGYTGGWYDKTSFRIDFTMNGQPDNYEGRQDFGDGEGSLIQHIQNYHEYYTKDENWKNFVLHNKGPEAWEQDKAEREMVLTEFIPYLKQHCNLSAMERAATTALREEQNISPEQAAYYNTVVAYVQDCRPLLNQGQYNLPEPPKLADFDQSLQDYKAQVQAEIAQEAATAGMTVEEYAAAGFEAPQQDSFSIYQLRNEDSTRDYRFEPYDRLQAVGLTVDKANYTEVYAAPLTAGTTLEDIYRTFNVDYPADFKGHSLSVSDVVVLHQNGQDTAHYCDSVGFQQVPEFLRENPLRTAELSTEQNENMIDGVLNNAPSLGELEAKAKAGEQISLTDLAAAVKAEEKAPKAKKSRTAKPKKPSIRVQLDAAKKEQSKQTQPREKTKELEV